MDVRIQVKAGGHSDGGDEEAARALMTELTDIPRVSTAMAAGGPAPPGSKAVGLGVAEIIIGLGAAGALIPTVVNAVRDWLLRQPPAASLKIKDGDFEFEWTGATPPSQVNELIADLIERRKS